MRNERNVKNKAMRVPLIPLVPIAIVSSLFCRICSGLVLIIAITLITESIYPKTVFAAEEMSDDFSKSGLSFESFGDQKYDEINKKNTCELNSDSPRPLFNLLLKWSTHEDGNMVNLFIHDVCVAEYMPLGQDRFLVRYRGIGVANVGTGEYSRLYAPWVEEDLISKLHKFNSDTSIAIYQTIFSRGGEEYRGFYAIFFRRTSPGETMIQYAALISGDAGYVEDGSNEPFCPEKGTGPEPSPSFVTSILAPSVRTIPNQRKAIFTFAERSKNCRTGIKTDVRKSFLYRDGKLIDQNGKFIRIKNLGKE
jgi:hypothetical protein